MVYGYVRVSKKEQNIERQIKSIEMYNLAVDKIFIDKKSGKDLARKEYQQMKSILKCGDEIIIHELDRLGRNKEDIKSEISWYNTNNIIIRILDIPTTLTVVTGEKWLFEMINNIIIEVYSSVAEKERERLIKRTKEGLEQAKARGQKLGRPTISIKKEDNIIDMHKRGFSITEISTISKVSKSTVRNKINKRAKK